MFGDLDDPGSDIAKLVRTKGAKGRLEEQGTKPKVLYIGLDEHLGR